ncbi:Mu transposase C-terminal domain-containing protein [Endozoicomonas ascidiicola]|uniref:Mu transposase C-terminal domain-containing protein n=1 Tax=Endozoicomonas ascidiicola TaxID=1698521 RepID=UPI00082B24A7|nr:DDE-type integrase/transposase/recombinase [Endozoicomonas ascidiicola]
MDKPKALLEYVKANAERLGVNDEGLDYVQQSMGNPVRHINRGGPGRASLFPSPLMGVVNKSESDLEKALQIMSEMKPSVRGIFDQPITFQISPVMKNGKRQGIRHTPDAFLVEEDAVSFVECKRVAELMELCEKYPDRYIYDEVEGCFRSPVMERELKRTGVKYRFFTDADCNPKLLANIRHLLDYIRVLKKKEAVSSEIEQACVSFIGSSPTMTISEFLVGHPALKIDHVLQLVASGALYVAMERELLSEPETCRVFTSKSACQVYITTRDVKPSNGFHFKSSEMAVKEGMVCQRGGQVWKLQSIDPSRQTVLIEITGEGLSQLKPVRIQDVRELIKSKELEVVEGDQSNDKLNDEQTQMMLAANEDHQKEALKRHHTLHQVLMGDMNRQQAAEYLGCSTRTLRRYMKRYAEGIDRRGNGLAELVDNHRGKGNSQSFINGKPLELADDVIESEYLDAKCKSVAACYRDYVRLCKDEGVEPGSYSWMRRRIKTVSLSKRVRTRQGHKKANALMPITTSDGVIESRRGTRAFEYLHVDHTQLDEFLKFPNKKPAKPWLTVIVDLYSRSVLAIYLTMSSPSNNSVMMVVRELIKRHGRLPESFCVDGGAEFESVQFEQFCAYFSVTIHSRKSNPRGGSAVESVFKQLNEAVVHTLTGNSKLMKNPRQLSASVNPVLNALWDFQSLKQLLEDFFYGHYNKTEHPAHKMIPDEVLEDSFIRHGERDYRKVGADDENLRIMMLPHDGNKRTRVIQPVKGVVRKGLYYGHELFSSADWLGKEVELRIDPEDDSYVYCNLDGWKRCERVVTEGRYFPGIDRSVLTEANGYTHSFYSQKEIAERAVPFNRKISDEEKRLREGVEEVENKSTAVSDSDASSIRIVPGENNIEDF